MALTVFVHAVADDSQVLHSPRDVLYFNAVYTEGHTCSAYASALRGGCGPNKGLSSKRIVSQRKNKGVS